jgi:NAD(P) transhydrogenase subunit alpha
MRIGVPREVAPGERRVALAPDSVGRLAKAGHSVLVERCAGVQAGFPDDAYRGAGAEVVADGASLYARAELVTKVRRPTTDEAEQLAPDSILIALLQPAAGGDVLDRLATRGVTALALERVPRITRAQAMDVLSSQATVAGYKAVLLGAVRMPKFLPMLTTAAGTIAPGRAFVVGAGVAGLQAIATARRLGAVVSAFDVRPAVREQVQSLGATFVAAEVLPDAEAAGGYAREQTEEEQARVARAIHGAVKDADLVVTTAQVPGRPAPRLITEAMVADMRPGTVIVDLAAESGGNCALTRPEETVEAYGVTILGPINLPSTVPFHASQMLSRNVFALLQHLLKDGRAVIDLADEITGAMVVTHAGEHRQS